MALHGIPCFMHVMQLKSEQLPDLLSPHSDAVDVVSDVTYSTNGPVARVKHKLGEDVVEDFKTVSIGQSAYFTGVLAVV
jgi:hypothetical protein